MNKASIRNSQLVTRADNTVKFGKSKIQPHEISQILHQNTNEVVENTSKLLLNRFLLFNYSLMVVEVKLKTKSSRLFL